MIINPTEESNRAEDITPSPDRNFMEGYYDGKNQEVHYDSFISDIQDIASDNSYRILNYLSNDLTKIYQNSSDKEPTRISYKGTDDSNVELMQEKLFTLGATDTPLEDQNFYIERSYTISTFRMLFMAANLIREMNNTPFNNENQLMEILLDHLEKQTTSKIEEDFREPVYNNRGILLCRFKDADMRRVSEYINPEGKVTKMEMATDILPRVKRILKNIAKSHPAFT